MAYIEVSIPWIDGGNGKPCGNCLDFDKEDRKIADIILNPDKLPADYAGLTTIRGTYVRTEPSADSDRRYIFLINDVFLDGQPFMDCMVSNLICLDCCDLQKACPKPIPDSAFTDALNPTEGEILTWLTANPSSPLDEWYVAGNGTDLNPDWLVKIKECDGGNKSIIVKQPSAGEQDTNTVTNLVDNGDGSWGVFVDGVLTTTITTTNVVDNGDGTTTITDGQGDSYTGCPCEEVSINSTVINAPYTGGQPTSPHSNPNEGDTFFETYTSAQGDTYVVGFTYDDDTGQWLSASSGTISSVTEFVNNSTYQVHGNGTTNTSIGAINNDNNALSGGTVPLSQAVDELANRNRSWSDDGTQKTNAHNVGYEDPISHNEKVVVNSTSTALNATLYVSNQGNGGDGNAKFDGTIAIRTNPTSETGNFNLDDAIIYNSGRPTFKSNEIRCVTGDQMLFLEGGSGGTDGGPTHGGGIALMGNQFLSSPTQYTRGGVMIWSGRYGQTDSNNRIMMTNIIDQTDSNYTNDLRAIIHGRAVNSTSMDLHMGVLSLRESIAGAPSNIPTRNDYGNIWMYGGALFARSTNNSTLTPINTVTQLTGHVVDIIEPLQEEGVLPKRIDAKLITVNPTYDVVEAKCAFNILSYYVEVNLSNGEYVVVTSDSEVTGKIDISTERSGIVNLPTLRVGGTNKERFNEVENLNAVRSKEEISEWDKAVKDLEGKSKNLALTVEAFQADREKNAPLELEELAKLEEETPEYKELKAFIANAELNFSKIKEEEVKLIKSYEELLVSEPVKYKKRKNPYS